MTFWVGWVTVETVVWDCAEAGVVLGFLVVSLSDRVEYSSGLRTAMLDFRCHAFWKGRLRGRGWVRALIELVVVVVDVAGVAAAVGAVGLDSFDGG